jgi:hypothetical protein
MLVVTSFTSDKCFGGVGIGQRILEGNITVGKEGEAWNAVIPTIRGTSLCSLSAMLPSELGGRGLFMIQKYYI